MRERTSRSLAILALGGAVALAACGDAPQASFVEDDDPALAGALADQIMVDPDLVGLNRANAVAAMPPVDGSLPTIDRSPEMIAAARAEALQLIGGPGMLRKAGEPRELAGAPPPGSALTVAARAAAAPRADADCIGRARYTMQWAARMPDAFPVYPRGAVQEAMGTDGDGCALRAINFVTPVPLGEVIDFYFTRASAAGYSAERVLQDGDDVLAGTRGKASYAVYARTLPTGNTQIDLVTNDG